MSLLTQIGVQGTGALGWDNNSWYNNHTDGIDCCEALMLEMRTLIMVALRCYNSVILHTKSCNRTSGPGIKLRRGFHTNLNIYHSSQEANYQSPVQARFPCWEVFFIVRRKLFQSVPSNQTIIILSLALSLSPRVVCCILTLHFAKLLIWLNPKEVHLFGSIYGPRQNCCNLSPWTCSFLNN